MKKKQQHFKMFGFGKWDTILSINPLFLNFTVVLFCLAKLGMTLNLHCNKLKGRSHAVFFFFINSCLAWPLMVNNHIASILASRGPMNWNELRCSLCVRTTLFILWTVCRSMYLTCQITFNIAWMNTCTYKAWD